jgi:hypothetical protein
MSIKLPATCPSGQILGGQGTCVPASASPTVPEEEPTPHPAPEGDKADYVPWIIAGAVGVILVGTAVVVLRQK